MSTSNTFRNDDKPPVTIDTYDNTPPPPVEPPKP
jgi:hypothetical protein